MSKRKKKEWQAVPIEQFHYDTGIPMTEEEVQGLLQFRKRGYYIKNKKGKASYDRARENKEMKNSYEYERE